MQKSTVRKLIKMTNELYEKEAESFDKTRNQIWEKEILDFIGKIKPGSSILDLGCGNARLLSQILPRITHRYPQMADHKYLGIDTSKELIKQNQKKYGSDATVGVNYRFRIGDGLNFPPKADQPMTEKDKFDYIISIAVLHHIPSKELQTKFLKNIYNALKPNGKTLITVWNRWQPKYRKYFSKEYKNNTMKTYPRYSASLSALVRELDQNDLVVSWKQSGQFRYIHAFKPDELKNLALKAGFKKIKVFASKMGKITNLDNALNIYLQAEK